MKKSLITFLAWALAVAGSAQSRETIYVGADGFPVHGKAVEETSARYERLPESLRGVSRTPVWNLGRNSAGIYIRFRSDSPSISARWTSYPDSHMGHMADAGDNGLDLYSLVDGKWQFVGTAFGSSENGKKEKLIVGDMEPVMREYMMYLSLYDGVKDLSIGIEKGFRIERPEVESPKTRKRVVMYGTSILQGGCASRPGMAYTNILSRRLDREVVNLGFSGNARLDYEIAGLIAKVEDPGAIVLDFLPNCVADSVYKKAERFYHIVRDAHPRVPIVFVGMPFYAHYYFNTSVRKTIDDRNEAINAIFKKLRREGEKDIFLMPADGMFGHDNEATVDGTHPTDLGMMRYADFMYPTLDKLLKRWK